MKKRTAQLPVILWGIAVYLAIALVLVLLWFLIGCSSDRCRSNADCRPGLYCTSEGTCERFTPSDAGDAPSVFVEPELLVKLKGTTPAPWVDTDAGTDSALPSDGAGGDGAASTDSAPPATDSGATDAGPAWPLCEAAPTCTVWCSEPCTSACWGGPYASVCGPLETGYWCCWN